MRIAIGALAQEVNTFSPVPTTLKDFEANGIAYGQDIITQSTGRGELGGFMRAAQEDGGVELVPNMAASAMPLGRPTRETHQFLRNAFLARLRSAGKLDGILLALHGAMSAEDEDDVEGALLADIRQERGTEMPIGICLDHHANITQKLIDNVTVLVGYHRQPHVDALETGYNAARLLVDAIKGRTRPVIRWRKIPMLASGNILTPDGPLGEFFGRGEAWEREGKALSVSIFPEFMFSDTPEVGWSVVAITDNDPTAAQAMADQLARGLWEKRRLFMPEGRPTPAEAVRRALQVDGGPVVLGDFGDNTAGGAYGDSTAILKELLGKELGGKAFVAVVDPEAVAQCVKAGVGKTVTLEVGGKVDHVNFKPVRVTGRVKTLTDGRYNSVVGPTTMKRAAVLEAGDVNILLCEIPSINLDPSIYRSVGLEPKDARIVVVKAAYNFRAYYGSFAKEMIVVNSPGVTSQDLRSFPWKKVRRPMFPLDEDATFVI